MFHYSGTVIHCYPSEVCLNEGENFTVICNRSLNVTVPSSARVKWNSHRLVLCVFTYGLVRSLFPSISSSSPSLSPHLSVDRSDYVPINIDKLLFRVPAKETVKTFTVSINTDNDDTEPQEYFFISFEPIRNALYLPPRIEIRICVGKYIIIIIMPEVIILPYGLLTPK